MDFAKARSLLGRISIPDRAFPAGSLFGVPVRVSGSAGILVGIVIGSAAGTFAHWLPQGTPAPWHLALGVLGCAIFLASLTAHEFAHVLVARHYGVGCEDATLTPLGMVARLEGECATPAQEAAVVAAGPGMNAVLAVAAWFAATALPAGSVPSLLAWFLCIVNTVLGTFNMVPCYPMDGGRLVRSLAWWWTGDIVRGTQAASVVGWAGAGILVAAGALLLAGGNPYGILYMAIAVAMLGHASREVSDRKALAAFAAIRADGIMKRFGMGEAADVPGVSIVPVLDRGVPRSAVAVWRGTERTATLDPADVGTVAPELGLDAIMDAFGRRPQGAWPILIVSDGRPLGYLTQGQVKGILDAGPYGDGAQDGARSGA